MNAENPGRPHDETSSADASRPGPAAGGVVLSIATCVYNEEALVGELVERVTRACAGLGVAYEVVVVNDGSRDATLARLIELSRATPALRVVNLYRNFGHMSALSAALAAARGRAIVLMDGDLQDPPELIPRLFEEWQRGADVILGQRTRRHESRVQRVATTAFYWLLSRISEVPIPPQVGTFSLLDQRVAALLAAMPERQRYVAGLRAWVGGRTAAVSYERPARVRGASRVGLPGLLRLARTSIFSFSKAPLRWAAAFSLLCGLVLLCVGLWAIIMRLFTDKAIPGWATSTTLIGMMGFVQSLAFAVLAEYVAIIFDELKARPLFLARDEFVNGERVEPAGPERGGRQSAG